MNSQALETEERGSPKFQNIPRFHFLNVILFSVLIAQSANYISPNSRRKIAIEREICNYIKCPDEFCSES